MIRYYALLVFTLFRLLFWRRDSIVLRGSILNRRWSAVYSDLDFSIFTTKKNQLTNSKTISLFKILVPYAREIEIYDEDKIELFLNHHCLYQSEFNDIKLYGPIPTSIELDKFTREHILLQKFFFSYFVLSRTVRVDNEQFNKTNFGLLRHNGKKVLAHLSRLEKLYKISSSNLLFSSRLENLAKEIEKSELFESVRTVIPSFVSSGNALFETNFYLFLERDHKIYTGPKRNTMFLPRALFYYLYNLGIIDPLVIYKNQESLPSNIKDRLIKFWEISLHTMPYLQGYCAREQKE